MAVKFLYLNDFDNGIVTASSEAAGHLVSNLKHLWHTRHWRSTGLADEWVKVNLEEPKDIEGLVIKYHNFQAGATVRIQAHEDDTHWADPDLNELLTITADQIVKLWEAAETYQWWRILMSDAGNPDGYMRIGRPFLGAISALSKTFSSQYFYDLIDPSIVIKSSGGQASTNKKTKYKQMGYDFRGLTAGDKSILEAIFEAVGIAPAYFFCENVNDLLVYYVRNISSWRIQGMETSEDKFALTINVETMR